MNITQPYILVTGPQRSGTRIAAKILAHDLPDHHYVDEVEIHTDSLYALDFLLRRKEKVVVQCPALCRYIHWFGARDDVLIVMVMRDLADILASQERITWEWEALEKFRYGAWPGMIALAKYLYWKDAQKAMIEHWQELSYESLADHPLWVPKCDRLNFAPTQTEVEQ